MAHPYINTPLFAAKGGGTTKVCLPKSKVARMSPEEKKKVIRAKESAGRSGKRERSQRSEVSSARKPGATLKDWFEKENWINVKTGEECGAPTKMTTPFQKAEPRRTIGRGKNFNKVSEDKSATGAKAGGGMTQKGVNEYKRKNPGSKLQTAVTEKPSELKPGSKKWKRRKSFCARSKKWKSERGLAARRRWNC